MRLTKTQKRALTSLLEYGDWVNSYKLGYSVRTLSSLVENGLATSRGQNEKGALYSPEVVIEYKAINKEGSLK